MDFLQSTNLSPNQKQSYNLSNSPSVHKETSEQQNGFKEGQIPQKNGPKSLATIKNNEYSQQNLALDKTVKDQISNKEDVRGYQIEPKSPELAKKNSMKMSKVQKENEVLAFQKISISAENVQINIPETKIVKDGLMSTYLLYKVVSKVNQDSNQNPAEYNVFRRYSDFNWLYEALTTKYCGYVLPLIPPKNILTSLNKEGLEFAETRKKELFIFLQKCISHHFIQKAPELSYFLFDEIGFIEYKSKEQNSLDSKKDSSLFSGISKLLNGVTKAAPCSFTELSEVEGDLYQYELIFSNLRRRLQLLIGNLTDYLNIQRKQTDNMIFFTTGLRNILLDNRISGLEDPFGEVNSSQISKIEDESLKDLSDKIETILRDVLNTTESVNLAFERRNELATRVQNMHILIEGKSLKYKKEAEVGDEIEELKKEHEILKEQSQKAANVLLSEAQSYKERIDDELGFFLRSLLERKEYYFIEVYKLWSQNFKQE